MALRHRAKTVILLVLALGLLPVLFVAGSRSLFLDSYAELESSTMHTEVARAAESIRSELDQVDTIATDYSGWDDAYQFVQDGNRPFIKSNLSDAVFSKLKLSLVIFFNQEGAVVYRRMVDFQSNRELPIPPELWNHFQPDSPLIKLSAESSCKGFLAIPGGILMTVSRPVQTSDFKGTPKGTLVMGRFLDEELISVIAARTKRKLSFVTAAPTTPILVSTPQPLLQPEQEIRLAANNDAMYGYRNFNDFYGKHVFTLQVEAPRSILKQGEKTIRTFVVFFTALTLFSAGALYLVFARLTSSLQRQKESESRYHTLVDRAAEGIVLATMEGYFILDANPAFALLTGKSIQELRGTPLLELFDGSPDELTEESERILSETREMRLKHDSGDIKFTEVNASCISHEARPVLSVIVHNVTARKGLENQLMYQANHDPLTGLPNRILLNDRLSHALASAQRKKGGVVLMLLDLDHFKVINDTLGHSYGDQLLKETAQRFKAITRASDTIARIGGDEFVAVLTTLGKSDDVITVAHRFLEEICRPYRLGGEEFNISASIGIAQFPDDGYSAEELFKKADTAMYHVKERGRNGIQFYAEEMNRKNSIRLKIESCLRRAIEHNELSLHYQPQIQLASGRIIGMEVLLRWNSPELGQVDPAEFIPVAENSGLIVSIGTWALRTACLQYMQWRKQGLPPMRMAVNLSPRQFSQANLVDMVRQIIEESGIPPAELDLEVTESLMMNNVEDSIQKMVALKQLGTSLSIDDFGTGYSSLSCLQQFPLDILKIDRSFVTEIGNGSRSVIIRAIVAMAHSLGLSIVAEGVENVEQLNFLRNHHCEEVQGFYFSRPLTDANFFKLIKKTDGFEPNMTTLAPEPLNPNNLQETTNVSF